MGKAILVIILGTVVAGSVTYLQSSKTRIETTTRQALYQEQVLAREIARSANSIAHLKLQKAGSSYETAMANINGWGKGGSYSTVGKMSGQMQGGSYEVHATAVDGQNIRIDVTGIFNGVREVITSYHKVKMLVVKWPSKLRAEFDQSMAGYCSAVYIQQNIPISPGDSTGAVTGVVSSDGNWFIKHPEMLFTSGHNRDGSSVEPANLVLDTGTQMNFFIGVDPSCKHKGDWVDEYDKDDYAWVNYALDADSDLNDMQEGIYSMIEAHHTDEQRWRIAFEDLINFSEAQHADIKANGYGGSWDSVQETYYGTGWGVDVDGYRLLKDFGWKPDFSDQVIDIQLERCYDWCYDNVEVES